jgi:hypothetical protein
MKDNLVDIFKLLIDSLSYYGETLADYAKKWQLLPHLEALSPQLDSWQQEEHQLRKDIEKDYLLPLPKYITDDYRSLGNAEKNVSC